MITKNDIKTTAVDLFLINNALILLLLLLIINILISIIIINWSIALISNTRWNTVIGSDFSPARRLVLQDYDILKEERDCRDPPRSDRGARFLPFRLPITDFMSYDARGARRWGPTLSPSSIYVWFITTERAKGHCWWVSNFRISNFSGCEDHFMLFDGLMNDPNA